jgi:ribosomal protein S27AE
MKRIKYDYKIHFPENLKALKRDHFKCTKCGSKDSIIVHHKDESRRLGIKNMNRSLENLETLCRSCHALAHGYRLRYSFSKVTPELVIELRSNGLTYQKIGDHLGITRQRVHQIIKRSRSREEIKELIRWCKRK